MLPKYAKLERLTMKGHAVLDERWVQDRIAEDPNILGLGEVILKDKERIQPRAGRLDLLLQDSETSRRYEVEVQLGRTDESHIIRTVEYWDIERKRYPQYDHCAVLIAEDISSRFLNVIGLFNGTIPLIAIKMQALKVGDGVTLVFTTVIDELTRGFDEDDDEQTITDRAYWENRGTKQTVGMVDALLNLIREFDPALELKYNKFYIAPAKSRQPRNFVLFRPQKNGVKLAIRIKQAEDMTQKIEANGLELLGYDKRGGEGYSVRLSADDIKNKSEIIRDLMKLAYEQWGE
jgi:predicted transport protein